MIYQIDGPYLKQREFVLSPVELFFGDAKRSSYTLYDGTRGYFTFVKHGIFMFPEGASIRSTV